MKSTPEQAQLLGRIMQLVPHTRMHTLTERTLDEWLIRQLMCIRAGVIEPEEMVSRADLQAALAAYGGHISTRTAEYPALNATLHRRDICAPALREWAEAYIEVEKQTAAAHARLAANQTPAPPQPPAVQQVASIVGHVEPPRVEPPKA